MSTSLFRGIFKANIIRDKNIIFDTNIRYAEDWLFFAEYFKYVNTIVLISEPLYHYYQRKNSATNMFIPTSILGVKKSFYILEKFMSLAQMSKIDKNLYEPWMARRYIGLILNQSKNVWDKRNGLNLLKKKQILLLALNEVNCC